MPINAQSANPLMRLMGSVGRVFAATFPPSSNASYTPAPTAPPLPNSDGPLQPLAQQERLAREYKRLLSLQSDQARPRSGKQIETISRAYLLTHEILAEAPHDR